jgi:antitoxin component YwqK of YwqJK toxin-antitoxin module
MKLKTILTPIKLFVFSVCFLGNVNAQTQSIQEIAKKSVNLEEKDRIILVRCSNFSSGANMSAKGDSSNILQFVIDKIVPVPFCQSAVKQSTEEAQLGPNPSVPYFNVRFAMPTPPSYTNTNVSALVGLDPEVFQHNHSPGFEIMPNGDVLAIYFSTQTGISENDTSTSFVQSRLRYGSEEWDMPELFFKTKGCNDQSGLLWNDNGKIWFFGGGRDISNYVPFRIATSLDNGVSWEYSIPQLDKPATNYTAQPINSAFRGSNQSIYFAMDGADAHSFLFRSSDNGFHWNDMGGRTGGRHSVILPLDDKGSLISIGGKNANVNGWTPQNYSKDWGATWSESTAAPFPPLGTAQRPSLIRLASGNLLYVSDSYMHKKKIAPPEGWKYDDNCFVAISKDNGVTWHIKPLPVQLPQRHRIGHPALGYATVRQAPNGIIHILTTITLPCLQYEFNEAWVWSNEGDITPETSGGTIKQYIERYPNGQVRSKWSARICNNGRYLLNGEQIDYYENGTKQHQAIYENGRKVGEEAFWLPNGKKAWIWSRDLKTNHGVWTHYWENGNKRIESNWNLKPKARDLNRFFGGYVAEGPSKHWDENGHLIATYNFVKGDILNTSASKENDQY